MPPACSSQLPPMKVLRVRERRRSGSGAARREPLYATSASSTPGTSRRADCASSAGSDGAVFAWSGAGRRRGDLPALPDAAAVFTGWPALRCFDAARGQEALRGSGSSPSTVRTTTCALRSEPGCASLDECEDHRHARRRSLDEATDLKQRARLRGRRSSATSRRRTASSSPAALRRRARRGADRGADADQWSRSIYSRNYKIWSAASRPACAEVPHGAHSARARLGAVQRRHPPAVASWRRPP